MCIFFSQFYKRERYLWKKGEITVSIIVKESDGNDVVRDSCVGDHGATGEHGYAIFTDDRPVKDGEEGQIGATLPTEEKIKAGETYTIIITADGTTTTQKYTAI